MLVETGEGTFVTGRLDVVLILHHVEADTYHVCCFTEAPFPGTGGVSGDMVRLKSRAHHEQGAPTLAEAQVQLDALLQSVHFDEPNILREPAKPWDGELGLVMVVNNWRKPGSERTFAEA